MSVCVCFFNFPYQSSKGGISQRTLSAWTQVRSYSTMSPLNKAAVGASFLVCGRHPVCPTFRSSTLTPYLPETEGVCRPPMVIDIRGFFKYIAIKKQVDLGSGHLHCGRRSVEIWERLFYSWMRWKPQVFLSSSS
ncbi:hypothetical protein CDAR_533771 [Caerostris darwini]|uniref:Uncharacterized protein n=1 Tax=Caerostris darwini TaxID=1538125 RepID=A0AAV4S9W3_9ARAC|nr:hypothetical protein CDAR_533771 [Caerostris darwini]